MTLLQMVHHPFQKTDLPQMAPIQKVHQLPDLPVPLQTVRMAQIPHRLPQLPQHLLKDAVHPLSAHLWYSLPLSRLLVPCSLNFFLNCNPIRIFHIAIGLVHSRLFAF